MVNRVPVEGRRLRLASERLLLRDLRLGDWPAIHTLRSEPDVAGPMGLEPAGERESRAWLERAMYHNRLLPRHAYNMAIVRRETGDVAGWIGMSRLRAGEDAHYELSFALLRSCWGKGYMTEALRTLFGFAFDKLGVDCVVAECRPDNEASARVLQRVGMCYEGRASAEDSAGGRVTPCLRYKLRARDRQHQASAK